MLPQATNKELTKTDEEGCKNCLTLEEIVSAIESNLTCMKMISENKEPQRECRKWKQHEQYTLDIIDKVDETMKHLYLVLRQHERYSEHVQLLSLYKELRGNLEIIIK